MRGMRSAMNPTPILVRVPVPRVDSATIRAVESSRLAPIPEDVTEPTDRVTTEGFSGSNQISPVHRGTIEELVNPMAGLSIHSPEHITNGLPTPDRLSPASGRSPTRSRPMFQSLNTLPTHVLPVPNALTPRPPPVYEARENGLQTASRPNSQNIPYPQGDGHNTSTESIEIEIERQQFPRLVDNTPTLHSTHALNRPMGLYAYNIDADFGPFPMSCRLESSIQYTRVDIGNDEGHFTEIRVWYIPPPPEEY